jgi:hypothetical protein
MLVAEDRRRSNPRVLYGILAESALEQINARAPEDSSRRAYLQNLIRLLEMYRYDSLRRPSPRAVLDRRHTDLRSRERERLANGAVERALDAARAATYEGFDKAQLAEHLKGIFVLLMKGESAAVPQADIQRAKNFLRAFGTALRD